MSTQNKFQCCRCGGKNLGYQKYVKCIEPVAIHADHHIEYGPAAINQDDYLAAEFGFICADCGYFIYHCGRRIETEKELIDYLSSPPEKLAEEQKFYETCEKEIAEEDEAEEAARIQAYEFEAEEISECSRKTVAK